MGQANGASLKASHYPANYRTVGQRTPASLWRDEEPNGRLFTCKCRDWFSPPRSSSELDPATTLLLFCLTHLEAQAGLHHAGRGQMGVQGEQVADQKLETDSHLGLIWVPGPSPNRSSLPAPKPWAREAGLSKGPP